MMQKISIKSFPYIRIMACFSIIILHTLFATSVYFDECMTQTQKLTSQMIQNLMMWAVPCFLMITGALLLEPAKEISSRKLRKYIFRVVSALISVTFLFQCLEFLFEDEETIFSGWIYNLFTGQSWAHMWYLYLMIGIYLMIPFYKMIVNQATEKQLLGLISIFIIFLSILPLFRLLGVSTGFYIPTRIIYPAYLFLGYYLLKKNLPKWFLWILVLSSSILILSVTWIQWKTGNSALSEVLLGYSSIPIILQSVGIYKLLTVGNFKDNKIVYAIADSTFGIYLIHMVFVRMVFKWYGFDPYTGNGFSYLPVVLLIDVVIFFASLCISYSVKKAVRELY